jgi:hypothetical protein
MKASTGLERMKRKETLGNQEFFFLVRRYCTTIDSTITHPGARSSKGTTQMAPHHHLGPNRVSFWLSVHRFPFL